jgi:hypothetical protein
MDTLPICNLLIIFPLFSILKIEIRRKAEPSLKFPLTLPLSPAGRGRGMRKGG